MFTAALFIGLEVTPPLQKALLLADQQAIKAFVNDDDAYLQDISHGGKRYLGKYAGSQTDISSLELLEVNIRTLLAKILPPEGFADLPLHLFPLVEAEHHGRK